VKELKEKITFYRIAGRRGAGAWGRRNSRIPKDAFSSGPDANAFFQPCLSYDVLLVRHPFWY